MRRPRSFIFLLSVAVALGCGDRPDPVGPDAEGPALSTIPPNATLASPIFALATHPGGGFIVAEAGTLTRLKQSGKTSIASLPGVTGVVALGTDRLVALTGGGTVPPLPPTAQQLFRVSPKGVLSIADLDAFEAAVNPDQVWNTLPPESNPFALALLGDGTFLVADAAANDILHVEGEGLVDWVAVLTPQLASTLHARELFGCAGPQPAPPCATLPDFIPAQPVATSVAIGPDRAIYAGELTGFPAQPGISRVWRIASGSRHVLCPSQSCELFASGFTSIMDMIFGPDGRLYVAEFDLATWLGVQVLAAGGPLAPVDGGRVQACDPSTGTCTTVAVGLDLPTALASFRGRVWVAENETIPGTGRVRPLVDG